MTERDDQGPAPFTFDMSSFEVATPDDYAKLKQDIDEALNSTGVTETIVSVDDIQFGKLEVGIINEQRFGMALGPDDHEEQCQLRFTLIDGDPMTALRIRLSDTEGAEAELNGEIEIDTPVANSLTNAAVMLAWAIVALRSQPIAAEDERFSRRIGTLHDAIVDKLNAFDPASVIADVQSHIAADGKLGHVSEETRRLPSTILGIMRHDKSGIFRRIRQLDVYLDETGERVELSSADNTEYFINAKGETVPRQQTERSVDITTENEADETVDYRKRTVRLMATHRFLYTDNGPMPLYTVKTHVAGLGGDHTTAEEENYLASGKHRQSQLNTRPAAKTVMVGDINFADRNIAAAVKVATTQAEAYKLIDADEIDD